MKKYFADTNFYLRYILQDNEQQADKEVLSFDRDFAKLAGITSERNR